MSSTDVRELVYPSEEEDEHTAAADLSTEPDSFENELAGDLAYTCDRAADCQDTEGSADESAKCERLHSETEPDSSYFEQESASEASVEYERQWSPAPNASKFNNPENSKKEKLVFEYNNKPKIPAQVISVAVPGSSAREKMAQRWEEKLTRREAVNAIKGSLDTSGILRQKRMFYESQIAGNNPSKQAGGDREKTSSTIRCKPIASHGWRKGAGGKWYNLHSVPLVRPNLVNSRVNNFISKFNIPVKEKKSSDAYIRRNMVPLSERIKKLELTGSGEGENTENSVSKFKQDKICSRESLVKCHGSDLEQDEYKYSDCRSLNTSQNSASDPNEGSDTEKKGATSSIQMRDHPSTIIEPSDCVIISQAVYTTDNPTPSRPQESAGKIAPVVDYGIPIEENGGASADLSAILGDLDYRLSAIRQPEKTSEEDKKQFGETGKSKEIASDQELPLKTEMLQTSSVESDLQEKTTDEEGEFDYSVAPESVCETGTLKEPRAVLEDEHALIKEAASETVSTLLEVASALTEKKTSRSGSDLEESATPEFTRALEEMAPADDEVGTVDIPTYFVEEVEEDMRETGTKTEKENTFDTEQVGEKEIEIVTTLEEEDKKGPAGIVVEEIVPGSEQEEDTNEPEDTEFDMGKVMDIASKLEKLYASTFRSEEISLEADATRNSLENPSTYEDEISAAAEADLPVYGPPSDVYLDSSETGAETDDIDFRICPEAQEGFDFCQEMDHEEFIQILSDAVVQKLREHPKIFVCPPKSSSSLSSQAGSPDIMRPISKYKKPKSRPIAEQAKPQKQKSNKKSAEKKPASVKIEPTSAVNAKFLLVGLGVTIVLILLFAYFWHHVVASVTVPCPRYRMSHLSPYMNSPWELAMDWYRRRQ